MNLYKPMEANFKKGLDRLAYWNQWNLFEKMFKSANLVTTYRKALSFCKAGIFAPSFIRTNGKFERYPLRTCSGGTYMARYSGHFPTSLFLL